jgi:hypothetical protein
MFDTLTLALTIAIFCYVLYILLKAYKPAWFRSGSPIETFITTPKLNMPALSPPAPAPIIRADPIQAPRTVSPGGPGAPNAAAAPAPAVISPEEQPMDPYDDKNMEAPIKDSMRHPELSFGPGQDNTGTRLAPLAGTASTKSLTSESPFSPDFAQNGGLFMDKVTANDLNSEDTYATA